MWLHYIKIQLALIYYQNKLGGSNVTEDILQLPTQRLVTRLP